MTPLWAGTSELVMAITMANVAPSAPVANHLRPLTLQPPSVRVARVAIIVGSEPAPGAGSVIAKHERIFPSTSGRRYCSRCAGVA